MKTWKKYLIGASVLALVALAFYFKVYIPKTTFEIQTPKIASLDAQVFGIGTVNAKEIYTISSQVGGKITYRNQCNYQCNRSIYWRCKWTNEF